MRFHAVLVNRKTDFSGGGGSIPWTVPWVLRALLRHGNGPLSASPEG